MPPGFRARGSRRASGISYFRRVPLCGVAAAAIAFAAWLALAIQLGVVMWFGASFAVALWILLRFFTILTNALVAVVFTGIAAGRKEFASPRVVGGTAVSILFVGVAYTLLPHGTEELNGAAVTANVMLHFVTPALVACYWLAFTRKGRLGGRDVPIWAMYPTSYLAYSSVRTFWEKAPYPFLDYWALGTARTALHAVLIAICFLIACAAMVAFDRWLGRRETMNASEVHRCS